MNGCNVNVINSSFDSCYSQTNSRIIHLLDFNYFNIEDSTSNKCNGSTRGGICRRNILKSSNISNYIFNNCNADSGRGVFFFIFNFFFSYF